jgi:hypothetical protein
VKGSSRRNRSGSRDKTKDKGKGKARESSEGESGGRHKGKTRAKRSQTPRPPRDLSEEDSGNQTPTPGGRVRSDTSSDLDLSSLYTEVEGASQSDSSEKRRAEVRHADLDRGRRERRYRLGDIWYAVGASAQGTGVDLINTCVGLCSMTWMRSCGHESEGPHDESLDGRGKHLR